MVRFEQVVAVAEIVSNHPAVEAVLINDQAMVREIKAWNVGRQGCAELLPNQVDAGNLVESGQGRGQDRALLPLQEFQPTRLRYAGHEPAGMVFKCQPEGCIVVLFMAEL